MTSQTESAKVSTDQYRGKTAQIGQLGSASESLANLVEHLLTFANVVTVQASEQAALPHPLA